MDLKKTFGTDKNKETSGIVKQLGDGAWVRIARMGNPEFERVFAELSEPYRLQIQRGTMDKKLQQRIFIQAIAKTILLDWDGLTIDESAIDYTSKTAEQFLTDFPDFLELIVSEASKLENFKTQADENMEGNSEAS